MNQLNENGAFLNNKGYSLEKFELVDKNGIVPKDLYDGLAQYVARNLSSVSSSQMRKFYNEVKTISRKPDVKKDFDKHIASIMLLKSKIAYACGREPNNNGLKNFKTFITRGLEQVEDFY